MTIFWQSLSSAVTILPAHRKHDGGGGVPPPDARSAVPLHHLVISEQVLTLILFEKRSAYAKRESILRAPSQFCAGAYDFFTRELRFEIRVRLATCIHCSIILSYLPCADSSVAIDYDLHL